MVSCPVPQTLRFSVLPGRFAVCRLERDAPVPPWAKGDLSRRPSVADALVSVTRTADELSIVCLEEAVPAGARAQRGYRCFKLLGPFALDETGVLLSFIAPLAEREIPVFTLSTFDTDFVLISAAQFDAALDALQSAGHQLV